MTHLLNTNANVQLLAVIPRLSTANYYGETISNRIIEIRSFKKITNAAESPSTNRILIEALEAIFQFEIIQSELISENSDFTFLFI